MDAEKLLAKLIRKMSHRGTIRRGAASRAAEYMGLPKTTVYRWIYGNVTPSRHVLPMISALVSRSDVDFSARKSGPKALILIGIQRDGKLVS